MLTTFDRYLLFRYLYVVAGMFLAAWGLYVIVDGFTNIDIRGATEKAGPVAMLLELGTYYVYQSTMIFDLVGPTIAVLSVMIVLAMMLRQGEVHPVLAAGVPTYRLMWPFALGIGFVIALLVGNQEVLIPHLADRLQGPRGEVRSSGRTVEPQYDTRWWIFVSGRELFLGERKVRDAEFRLPETLSSLQQPLRAQEAINLPASGTKPAGWLLRNVTPTPQNLELTETGRQILVPQRNGTDVFLACDLTIEQLYKQNTAFKYLSTAELIGRIRRPTGQSASIRGQIVQVHSRLTRPILMLLGMFLVFPLTVRKEKDSLIGNISVTMATLGCVFGLWQGGQFLGQSAVMPAELAAWSPLVFGGSLSAWLTGVLRT